MPNRAHEIASKGMGKAKAAKAQIKGLKGIFKKLTEEHGEVSALLKRVKASSDAELRADLFPKIKKELLAHETGEVNELYPVLRQHAETQSIADDHDREAGELESLLDQLTAQPYTSQHWDATFDELVNLVQHHTKEEENQYFPKAQKVIGEEAAKDLEERYLRAKQSAMHEFS